MTQTYQIIDNRRKKATYNEKKKKRDLKKKLISLKEILSIFLYFTRFLTEYILQFKVFLFQLHSS
jgi:cell division protein FtsB